MSHNIDNNDKNNKRTCPCKKLPLSLSSLTGAEFGDVHSLLRHVRNPVHAITQKRDSAGNTPLHLAAQHGHVNATAILLAAGCDVNGLDGHSGATPLHRASFAGAVATMQLLLQCPDCDLLLRDASFGDGRTALHKAAAGGRYLAVQLLLQAHQEREQQRGGGGLRQALLARDAHSQTALQIAQSKIPNQMQERASVARWDIVAGGQRADWTLCAELLEQAEKAAQQQDDETVRSSPSLPSSLVEPKLSIGNRSSSSTLPTIMNNNTDDCWDCENGGECVTKSWETAFQKGLMQAVTMRQAAAAEVGSTKKNPALVSDDSKMTNRTTMDEYENESSARRQLAQNISNPSSSSDVEQDKTQRENENRNLVNSKNTSGDNKDDDDTLLGKPCAICTRQSFYLYSVSGSLLCRACKKQQQNQQQQSPPHVEK